VDPITFIVAFFASKFQSAHHLQMSAMNDRTQHLGASCDCRSKISFRAERFLSKGQQGTTSMPVRTNTYTWSRSEGIGGQNLASDPYVTIMLRAVSNSMQCQW